MSEQNGDQAKDKKDTAAAADSEQAKPLNPRIDFNGNLIKLLKGLVRHLNPDKVVDDMLRDFYRSRLPPYKKEGKGVKKGKYIKI